MPSGRPSSRPYLLPGRLSDVIAAVQVLAAHRNSERHVASWARTLSRDESAASVERWTNVFKQHPEFFLMYRIAGDDRAKAALRLRYTNKTVNPATGQHYSIEERNRLPEAQRNGLMSLPLGADQTEMLISSAINLHAGAIEEMSSGRWWQPLAISVVTTLLGVSGALAGVWISQTHSPSNRDCFAAASKPLSASDFRSGHLGNKFTDSHLTDHEIAAPPRAPS